MDRIMTLKITITYCTFQISEHNTTMSPLRASAEVEPFAVIAVTRHYALADPRLF